MKFFERIVNAVRPSLLMLFVSVALGLPVVADAAGIHPNLIIIPTNTEPGSVLGVSTNADRRLEVMDPSALASNPANVDVTSRLDVSGTGVFHVATNGQVNVEAPATFKNSTTLNAASATGGLSVAGGLVQSYQGASAVTSAQILVAATLRYYGTIDLTCSGSNGTAFVMPAPLVTNIGHYVTIHNDDLTNALVAGGAAIKGPAITIATNASVTFVGYSGTLWLPTGSYP